jgi:hypothetical protein
MLKSRTSNGTLELAAFPRTPATWFVPQVFHNCGKHCGKGDLREVLWEELPHFSFILRGESRILAIFWRLFPILRADQGPIA